jgi:Glutamine synthetase, catalytic domain
VYYRVRFSHVTISRIDTETGPGVFETALAYTTARRVADNALLFKYLVKSLGMKYGITPSFMAKPWGNVRISFPVVIRISDAIVTIGQLPGCSGFVQYRVIHQVLLLTESLPSKPHSRITPG